MSEQGSPLPADPDVHLSVILRGVRLDYVVCLTAAFIFMREHQSLHYTDAATVALGGTEGLSRLPNERLYLSL